MVENAFPGISPCFGGAGKKKFQKQRDFSQVPVWLCPEQSKDIGNCQDLNGFIQTSCEKPFQCWWLAQSTIFRGQFHPGMTHWKQLEVLDLFGSGEL